MLYEKEIEKYPEISLFLKNEKVVLVERLFSIWRKENLLLRIDCAEGKYVLKQINNSESDYEANKVEKLKQIYPGMIPKVFVKEKNAYLMEFIEGKNFFDLRPEEKVEKMIVCGRILSQNHRNGHHKPIDIETKIKESFMKYRKKSGRYFSEDELKNFDFSIFREVSSQPSHNDLNAANLLFYKGIRLIDPNEEGFDDVSKDIGRYCASVFFNNYDYFGNDKKHALDIASAFLSNFDESTLERAKYFIGESFLSFINFDTKTTPKETLKRLAMTMLTKKQSIIKNLEESI